MGKLVWLASYPKSGNTWARAFLHNYIAEPETPQPINELTALSAVECAAIWFDARDTRLTTEATQKRRPAVHAALRDLHDDLVFVKTHNANLALHGIPLCTPEHTAGAIVIVRDPRDIALSYSAFTGLPVDDVIAFMANANAANAPTTAQVFEFLSSWSAHVRSWAAFPHKILVRYEDLLTAPEVHFGRIIKYLGSDPAPTRLRRAMEFSTFTELAAQEATTGYRAAGPNASVPFFRNGTSGQWRSGLTPAQTAAIEAAHGGVMRKLDYMK